MVKNKKPVIAVFCGSKSGKKDIYRKKTQEINFNKIIQRENISNWTIANESFDPKMANICINYKLMHKIV